MIWPWLSRRYWRIGRSSFGVRSSAEMSSDVLSANNPSVIVAGSGSGLRAARSSAF